MKIAILKKPYCIEIEEKKLKAKLAPDEIRAKTVISALKLGTDRGNYEGAEDVPGAPTYPRWVGDSNIAIVQEIGSDVVEFKVGDRVVSQNPHQSEWIAKESTNICKIPEGVKDEDAVWSTLYTLSAYCYTKANFIPGENVAVVGLGILGLGAVAMGPIFGAKKTIAVGNSEVRNDMAKKMGADWILGSDEEISNKIDKITNYKGCDIAIDCAGGSNTPKLCVETVKTSGKVILVAIYGAKLGFDFNSIVSREIKIVGSLGYNKIDVESAIELLASKSVKVEEMISDIIQLEQMIDVGFKRMMKDEKDIYRILVSP